MLQELTNIFTTHSNHIFAKQSKAYMRNLFEFFGIKARERQTLTKAWIDTMDSFRTPEIIDIVRALFDCTQREYHYTAIDIVTNYIHRFSYAEVQELFPLIDKNAWWDTVDKWQKPFSIWIKEHKELQWEIMHYWLKQESFWLQRSAIILQLLWKDELNTEFLEKAILHNQDDEEFFIQKAIGWALRDYSKTDPTWVKNFLQTHKLSHLSVREASKYL